MLQGLVGISRAAIHIRLARTKGEAATSTSRSIRTRIHTNFQRPEVNAKTQQRSHPSNLSGEEFSSPGSAPLTEPMQCRFQRQIVTAQFISPQFARKVCNDSTVPLGIQCSRRCGCPHLCISHLGPMVLIAGLWLCNSASCSSRRPDVLPAGAGHSVPAGKTESSTTDHRGRVHRRTSHHVPTGSRNENRQRPGH